MSDLTRREPRDTVRDTVRDAAHDTRETARDVRDSAHNAAHNAGLTSGGPSGITSSGTGSGFGTTLGQGQGNYPFQGFQSSREYQDAQRHGQTSVDKLREAGEHALYAGRQVGRKAYHDVCEACHNWRHLPKFTTGVTLFTIFALGTLLGCMFLPSLSLFSRAKYSMYKDRDVRDAHEALDVLLDHMKAAQYHGMEPSVWYNTKSRFDRILDTIAHPFGGSRSSSGYSGMFSGGSNSNQCTTPFCMGESDRGYDISGRVADLGQRAKEAIYPSSSSSYGGISDQPGVIDRVKQWLPGSSGSSRGVGNMNVMDRGYGQSYGDSWKERLMSGGKLHSSDEVLDAASKLRHVTSEAESFPTRK